MLTAVQSGAYLHHLGLLTPDPAALASFYADVMDMRALRGGDGSWLCAGPRRRIVLAAGPVKQLREAVFACRDREGLDALRHRAQAEGLAPQSFPNALVRDAFVVQDPDGHRIAFGLAEPDESSGLAGLHGPLQHLTFASRDVDAFEGFYAGRLGFAVSDRVRDAAGTHMTCFTRSNHEHHTVACFKAPAAGIDHHSYEAGEWNTLRDWCDRFADRRIPLIWGPGRHGPGNNLFAFIEDPDHNWIEMSAELETVIDRPAREWPHEERSLNLWGRGILRA